MMMVELYESGLLAAVPSIPIAGTGRMRRLLCRLIMGNSELELHQCLQSVEVGLPSLRQFSHGSPFGKHDGKQASIKEVFLH
jgi:hypothetical protein